jgi:hypothetical protein
MIEMLEAGGVPSGYLKFGGAPMRYLLPKAGCRSQELSARGWWVR